MRGRRALVTVGAVVLVAAPVLAQDEAVARAAMALERVEAASATDPAGEARAEAVSGLSASIRELEERDARRQQEFAAAAGRALPAKAAERLRRAREAYQSGHLRLLDLLRQLAAPASTAAAVPNAIAEAREILNRLEDAARRPPISAADLPVRGPTLQAPLMGLASGTTTTVPIGPVPLSLKDAADALPGVVEVYEWVRNAITPEFYHGVMKGDIQTYLERAGNDADTASVLVQMVRAKGIPARYVRGTVELPGTTLIEVAGTANVEQAVRVLERAGIPHEVVLGAGGIASVKLERVWAEAYVPYANYRGAIMDAQGKVWLPLDPAFKRLTRPSGMDIAALGFDPRAAWDQYLAGIQSATPLEFVRGQIEQLLETRPGSSFDGVLNRRSFPAVVAGLLPNSLPYKVVSVTEVSYDLPDALTHTIRLLAERDGSTLLDVTLPVREVLGRRLTLSYQPASDEDAEVVTSYGSLGLVPPYLVEVRPVVRAGGALVAAGTPMGMAVSLTLRIDLNTPGGTQTITNIAVAGNTTAIGLGGRAVTAVEEGRDTAAEVLSGIARSYWQSWNDGDSELADLLKVVPLRPTVSVCLVSSAVEVEHAGGDPLYPVRYEWKGILIDADLRASAPVGIFSRESEEPFLLLSGLQGSILENRVFETRHDIPSISTAKAVGLAASQGVTVYDITSANVDEILPGLPFDASVKSEVRDAVERGLHVKIPAQPVAYLAWRGVGYILLDPATNEAAYQLQGGHSGGVTAPAVIDIPADLRDTVQFKSGEPKQDEDRGVARLQKYASTDFQMGTVDTPLQKPFRVLVTDGAGYPLANAWVTFAVIGGGGMLVDSGGGRKAEVDVRSNQDGIAQVTLALGKLTSTIPRFLLPEGGQEHATQVGLNLVTARAELARLDEPFFAFGLPDEQRDIDGNALAYLNLRGGLDAGWSPNLRVAARLSIGVNDPHGNPLSNFPIRFVYRPIPDPASAPGVTALRDPTDSPGGVLHPRDFARCVANTPVVRKGECAGEALAVVVRSSALGAFSYPVVGGSPFSWYYFDVETLLTPKVMWVAYPTVGPVCHAATRAACGARGLLPDAWTSAGTRGVLANTLGNLVEAYPPGGVGTIGLWTDVIYEKEKIVNYHSEDPPMDQFVAEGSNIWVREPLDNSEFKLTPDTAGTSVGGVGSVGGGRYEGPMTMAAAPMLNTVEWEATMRPKLIPYMTEKAARPGQIDPQHIDNTDPANPKLKERLVDPARYWKLRGQFSLWGARAQVSAVDPSPIFLRENLTTAHASNVRFSIEPPAFAQELLPVQVAFELKRGPESVLLANGSSREADGSFRIPADLPMPEGQYTVSLSVLGIAGREGGALVAQGAPVEAGIVTLTVDTNNDTIVDDKDDEAFRKDPSQAFAFWEADPDAEGGGKLVDWASLRIRLPRGLSSAEKISLLMPQSDWTLRKKYEAPSVCNGKAYLCDGESAAAQRVINELSQDDPSQPVSVGDFGRIEIRAETLQSETAWFLFRCEPRPEKRGCPSAAINLERWVAGQRVAVASTRILIKPLSSWMSLYTARQPAKPGTPRSKLQPVIGWASIPKRANKITVLLHGFNVSHEDAASLSFPTWFKRLYWVRHPVLVAQGDEEGVPHVIGVTWPGDEAGELPLASGYYPQDELNALQTGVPLGLFIGTELKGKEVKVFAHSLGNMAVNSAIDRLPGQAIKRYLMFDAAVAAETFSVTYAPDEVEVREMVPHAQRWGYPDDAMWTAQWYAMLVDHDEGRRDNCDAEGICMTDFDRWFTTIRKQNANLTTTRDYRVRWRSARHEQSPWRGLFAANPGKTEIFNLYNPVDDVLRIDLGAAIDLSSLTVHAWIDSQTWQKPKVGLLGIDPLGDNRRVQYWALLEDITQSDEDALWSMSPVSAPGRNAATLRHWGELAYWFSPLSGAAGAMSVPSLGAGRSYSLGEFGGSDNFLTTHSYLTAKPFPDVWAAYEQVRSILAIP